MTDLTEFLLARIAEDEAATAAGLASVEATSQEAASWAWVQRSRAECEAKRRIVEREMNSVTGITYRRMMVLQDLAAVYADHPDYRDEWRLRVPSRSAEGREA